MPKTLYPKVLATLTLATTVGVSGCVYPLARGSAAKVDEAFATFAAAEAPLDAPQNQIAQVQHTEKPLPPFARFFGGLFGKGRQEQPPADEPMPTESVPQTSVPESNIPVGTQPAKQVTPPISAESQRRNSPIVPAADLMNSQPKQSAVPPASSRRVTSSKNATVMRIGDESPQRNTQTPAALKPEPPTESALPVVISPHTSPKNDMPDVVSRFSEKAARIVEAAPAGTVEPSAQIVRQDSSADKPVSLQEQIDGLTKSPLAEADLLKRAKNNSSTESTTLTRALEIALDSMKDQADPPASQASERSLPAREEPAVKTPVASSMPEQRHMPAESVSTNGSRGPLGTSLGRAVNPLRRGGKTDWSGAASTAQAPQTVTNNTLSSYPKTNGKWTPSSFASTSGNDSAYAKSESQAPPAEPATTVNPYATAAEQEAQTPAKSVPAPRAKPMVVTNELAVPEPTTKPANPTDAIHFEATLLGKLKAAGQKIDWGPETPSAPQPSPEPEQPSVPPPAATEMPQVIEGENQEPGFPLVDVKQPQKEPVLAGGIVRSAIEPAKEPAPQPSGQAVSSKDGSDEKAAMPFVVSAAVPPTAKAPTRSGSQRGVLIRPAEKAPTPHVIRQNAKGWHTQDPVPVIHSEIPSRSTSGSGSKTYIVD
ncbi:hypothetical protein [Blastopirellula marina]|uniref:Uncharacterized protein n=1 Tax=Blastopirellula marina TaxID=124 RepID=A0A2S8GUW2_9BACT|nr:hypothetical protein [Blastopirellula marina]PQO48192.1 hypothetical protein C5Y93_00475 [Blastopirellula marina]